MFLSQFNMRINLEFDLFEELPKKIDVSTKSKLKFIMKKFASYLFTQCNDISKYRISF